MPDRAATHTAGSLGDLGLSFQEWAMRETLRLSDLQDAVLDFLRHRDDTVLFGAQAVNAYVAERRSTEDVDVASTRAAEIAEEIRSYLGERFHIAIRVREVRDGLGYRVDQVRKEGNRHLVDVRPTPVLPPARWVDDVLVVEPPELIANKTAAFVSRRAKPKAGTDWRDLAVLLLQFPELKTETGPVRERLDAAGAGAEVLEAWREIVAQEIVAEDDEDEFR